MNKEFKGQIIMTGDRFINYKSDGWVVVVFIYHDITDPYEQGMEYLIQIEILARCRYCIVTQTAGSRYAVALNGGKYEYKYIFDEGHYS